MFGGTERSQGLDLREKKNKLFAYSEQLLAMVVASATKHIRLPFLLLPQSHIEAKGLISHNKVSCFYHAEFSLLFRVLCWDNFSHQQCFKPFKLLHQNLLVKMATYSQKGMNISEWVNKIILLQSPNSSHVRPRLTDSLAKLRLISRSWNNQFHNPETKW